MVALLSALADRGRGSASRQEQARAALVFLFRHALGRSLPPLEGVTPATRPQRLPAVLTRGEVAAAYDAIVVQNADALMLGKETSFSADPAQTIDAAVKVIRRAEEDLEKGAA